MKYKKEEFKHSIIINCKKYTVNEKPTCMAYFKEKECIFLGWEGFKPVCTFTGEKLRETVEEKFIEPAKNCPIWGKNQKVED